MKKNEKSTPYFAEREEQAVIDYINSNSIEKKNEIYNEILIIPFRKMIQSIIRRYPIHIGNYGIDEVESNALSHLIEHMVKFNPNKITKLGNKTKAFSYCQTIVRNYCKDHTKKSYNEDKNILSFDDYADEFNNDEEYSYNIGDENSQQLEKLIDIIIKRIDEMIDDETMKTNEIIVGDAIINILQNWHLLFMEDDPSGKYQKKVTNKFAKNKILFYLKEQTRLSTKEIRVAIKPFKEVYFIDKDKFLSQ
jgi:hypothetical protein